MTGLRRPFVPSRPLEGDKREQLACRVCGVFFNGKSTLSDFFLNIYILWTITLVDHSFSLYVKMGKCKGKFKTAFEFYTPELFIVGDNFGAAAKF